MIDERELIAKIAKKDQNAFRMFFYIYKNRLYYYFYKLLENQEDAEDLTMETFLGFTEMRALLEEKARSPAGSLA